MDPEREVPDLVPVVPDEPRVRPLVLGRELGDVVALVVVAPRELARRLGLVAAEVARRRVALVPELLLERQGEQGAAEGVLTPDLGVGEAVPRDVEEAVLVDEAQDLCGQGLLAARLLQLRDVECFQARVLDCRLCELMSGLSRTRGDPRSAVVSAGYSYGAMSSVWVDDMLVYQRLDYDRTTPRLFII